jgi:hypothetical protein
MPPHDDTGTLKAMLTGRIRDLVADLAPGGKWVGRTYTAANPTRAEKRGESFVVWANGAWKEYDAGDTDKGDVFDLIAYCQAGPGKYRSPEARKAAFRWARSYVGMDGPAGRRPKMDRAAVDQAAADRAAQGLIEERARQARQIKGANAAFLHAQPTVEDTVAERYLAMRSIDLSVLPPLRALRFHPELPYVHGDFKTKFPAIIAAMSGPLDGIQAVHRTYLAPDGRGKAPVPPGCPAKKMMGVARGAAVRITRGATGLRPEVAGARGIREMLVLTEGIEDALSVAMARPDLRIWAAGSLAGLASVQLPACADHVVVIADNDWQSPAAQAGLDKAIATLQAQGVAVSVGRSPIGKDVNDCLRASS